MYAGYLSLLAYGLHLQARLSGRGSSYVQKQDRWRSLRRRCLPAEPENEGNSPCARSLNDPHGGTWEDPPKGWPKLHDKAVNPTAKALAKPSTSPTGLHKFL